MNKEYDVVVIGAGPAGYIAAIRCAQLGLKTACIDKWSTEDGKPSPGGTCLNVGCIPSKALLETSKHFHQLQHNYENHGIKTKQVTFDTTTMLNRKQKIVNQLTGGVTQLLKANKVGFFHGVGQITDKHTVTVNKEKLTTKHIIIATGSAPIELPNIPFDGEYIVDNEGALAFDNPPQKLGVIGAGVIGLELGSVWSRLGSEVITLEAMDTFLGPLDNDVSRLAQREFKKQNLNIQLNSKVTSAEVKRKKVHITYENDKGSQQITVDKLLVAVGRRPYSNDLFDKKLGIKTNEKGQVIVDDYCQTSIDNIWAIGDVVRGPMLAHKGSEEGVAVAETIAGHKNHIHFNTVPWVIYTEPEIAWVGKTEKVLKEEGINYKVGTYPFAANGRALGMDEPAGMVKVIADEKTDRLLGAQIIGANASELIAEIVVTMEFCGSSEDLARIIHAHPTLSEAIHEAALNVDKRAIHKMN